MKVLLIGSGGREHALAWKLAKSDKITTVFVAPGNSGTMLESKVINTNILKIDELVTFALQENIAFTLVGPEAPLADGIVDEFRKHGLKIWGPTKFASQLESSKVFAKNFMVKYNIPTAQYQTFTEINKALDYLNQQSLPIVIKADGLASGKGVLVATTYSEATTFIEDTLLNNKFGNSGNKIIIEEFISGVEASFIVMIDGQNILSLATSQDHKRLLDQDQGPNTGGMGAYSPTPIITDKIHKHVIEKIIKPVIYGMKQEGYEYTGFLYAGLMINPQGKIYTLEFNCRMGDPETQPIITRLETDLVDLIEAGINKKLDQVSAKWKNQIAIGIVLATSGYPESPKLGDKITGIKEASLLDNIHIFHAGTKLKDGELYTSGGRVLCVVGQGSTIHEARKTAYQAVNMIKFSGMHFRQDIAKAII